MKFLLRTFAVSLMACCQLAGGQNAGNVSQAAAAPNPCRTGGVEVVSNTSAADILPYADECDSITDVAWNFLMPKEAEYPWLAKGQVAIQFEIQRDGKIRHHSMAFVSRSGNLALDHAAWKAIKKSRYPPLPKEFKRPYLALRFCFEYNMPSPGHSGADDKAPKS